MNAALAFFVGALAGVVGMVGVIVGFLYYSIPEPPPAEAQPVFLVRRVEMTLHDARTGPEHRSPSWQVPRTKFVCVESR